MRKKTDGSGDRKTRKIKLKGRSKINTGKEKSKNATTGKKDVTKNDLLEKGERTKAMKENLKRSGLGSTNGRPGGRLALDGKEKKEKNSRGGDEGRVNNKDADG